MPDVINFEKQMKRGNVVGEWEKADTQKERSDKKAKEEKSKENAREKVKERASKKRRSDVRYDSPVLISQPTLSYDLKCSTRGEEEEEDDLPSTSKTTEAVVRIMTTKVQVSEDTKKVWATFRDSLPHLCLPLTLGSDKTRCKIHRQTSGMHTFDR